MKPHLIAVLVPVSLFLAAGLVGALLLWVWPGGGTSSGEFPKFVYDSPAAERGYRQASQHPRLFSQVACYCGCANLLKEPHHSLLDCFMNDDRTFDSHAVGCTLCLEIANDAVAWQTLGATAGEVVTLVDMKYRSYGPPTTR